MARFRYRAIDRTDALHQGEMEAFNTDDVVGQLSQRGWTVVDASEALLPGTRTSLLRSFGRPSASRRNVRDLEILLSEWSRLISIGLTIAQAVRFSMDSHGSTPIGALARTIDVGLKSGLSLERALAKTVTGMPSVIGTAIAAAERSGHLPQAMERISTRLRADRAFAGELRSALMYPSFVLFTAGGVLIVLFAFVIPSIADVVMGSGNPLPWNAELVFKTGLFMRENGALIIVGTLAGALLLALSVRLSSMRGLFERLLIHLPFVGQIMVARDASQFSRILASQLQGGVTIVHAIATARASLSMHIFKERSEELQRRVAEGSRLSEAVAACFGAASALPSFVRIGEESGRLDGMLDHAADHYEFQARRLLGHVSTLATPLVTVVIGVIVGGVVLSVMSALIGLNDAALR